MSKTWCGKRREMTVLGSETGAPHYNQTVRHFGGKLSNSTHHSWILARSPCGAYLFLGKRANPRVRVLDSTALVRGELVFVWNASHCNMQHTATCSTAQHTATRNALVRARLVCVREMQHTSTLSTVQHAATRITLQHATHCNTQCNTERIAARCNTHYTATCNTLQHTLHYTLQHTLQHAPHCNAHCTTHFTTRCNTHYIATCNHHAVHCNMQHIHCSTQHTGRGMAGVRVTWLIHMCDLTHSVV